uniref:Uncharacterized protein n=1 Tax=Opuntia streptacantha TaxID=393608 RepID=A0A7C8ZTX9_OPUST
MGCFKIWLNKSFVHRIHRFRDLMNYFFRLLPSTLNVPQDTFHQVKMHSTCYGHTKIQQRPQFLTQRINAFNNNNTRARDFNCSVAYSRAGLEIIYRNLNRVPCF